MRSALQQVRGWTHPQFDEIHERWSIWHSGHTLVRTHEERFAVERRICRHYFGPFTRITFTRCVERRTNRDDQIELITQFASRTALPCFESCILECRERARHGIEDFLNARGRLAKEPRHNGFDANRKQRPLEFGCQHASRHGFS
jgi:hypothetical protein